MKNDTIRQLIGFAIFLIVFILAYQNMDIFPALSIAGLVTVFANYFVKVSWLFPTREDYVEDEKEQGTYKQNIRIPSTVNPEVINAITDKINSLKSISSNILLDLIGNKINSGATLELKNNLIQSISEYEKIEDQQDINVFHKLYTHYTIKNQEDKTNFYLEKFHEIGGKNGVFGMSLAQTLSLAMKKVENLNEDSKTAQIEALHSGPLATVKFINTYIEKNIKESFIDASLHYDSIMMPISFIDKFSLASIIVNFAKHFDKPIDNYVNNAEPNFGRLLKQVQIANRGNLDEYLTRVSITEQFISNGEGTLNLVQGCELGLFIRLLKEIGQ